MCAYLSLTSILMMKVELKRKPLPTNVQKYVDRFGHLPSMESFKFLTPQQMDDIAAKALEEGQPIPEWRDRATMKTDTILDKLYGMDPTQKD